MDEPQAPLTEALSDLERVIAFLDGSAKLEGSWYGQPSKHNAQFWWRINLREAMERLRAALSTAPVQGVLTEALNALRPFAALAKHYPTTRTFGNRPTTGIVHAVTGKDSEAGFTVEDLHAAAAAVELLGAVLASAPHPPSNTLGVPAQAPSGSVVASLPSIPDAAGHGLTAVGSISRGHLKPQPEPWCRDVFLYSPNNPGDSPEHRVMVYALKDAS